MTMTPLTRISVDDPGSPIPVDGNFQLIEDYVNTQLLNKDASIAVDPGSALVQETDPTQDNHVANKRYVDAFLPVGMLVPYAGVAAAPTGWVICDGAVKSSTDPIYAPLFAVIGTAYGDPGLGNFNLPDLRTKMPCGFSFGSTNFGTIGGTHGRTSTALPEHTHKQTAHTHSMSAHTHGAGSYATNSKLAEHIHGLTSGDAVFSRLDSGGSYGEPSTVGGGYGFDVHNSYDSEHDHDVNGTSGTNNDQTNDGSTNGSTANTESAGQDVEDRNYPPVVVMNYIIKL